MSRDPEWMGRGWMGRGLLDLITAGWLAGLGIAASAVPTAAAHKPHGHAKPLPAAPPVATPEENLIVRGRRFRAAPVPNQAIHDPAEALRDPATGAPLGRFGGAYIDASPLPPLIAGPMGDQSPLDVGARH